MAEVVNFAAVVNEGDSYHRAVDTGTGTEFYVIANPHRAEVGNFGPISKVLVGGDKSKSVCAEHDVGVNQAVVADHSARIEYYSWIDYGTGTYLNVFGHDHSWSDEHGGVNSRRSPSGPWNLGLPARKDGGPCGIGIRYSYDATLEFFGSLVFGVAEHHTGFA